MHKDTREGQVVDRQARLEVLHETLTDAVRGLVTGQDWRRAIEFAAKFRRYSFGNSLLLMVQGAAAFEAGLLPEPFPDYVAGYRQWQSLGRQVRAGSRGFQILAPTTTRVVVAEDGSFRRLARGEKPAPGETATTRMVGVRPATVFPDAFTDGGTPIPQRPTPQLLEGQAPPGLWDGLEALIRGTGFSVATVPSAEAIGGANGVTRWATKQVLVRADMDPLAMCKTLAHEAAHRTGHSPEDPDVPGHRGLIEVEAESAALLVLSAHNVDTSPYTVPYVSTWASRVQGVDPLAAVQQTAARVRTIALSILDGLDTVVVPDGDPPGLDRTAGEMTRSGAARVVSAPRPAAAPVAVSDDGLARPEHGGHHPRAAGPAGGAGR